MAEKEGRKPREMRKPDKTYIATRQAAKISDCCGKAVIERTVYDDKARAEVKLQICSQCHVPCKYHTITVTVPVEAKLYAGEDR